MYAYGLKRAFEKGADVYLRVYLVPGRERGRSRLVFKKGRGAYAQVGLADGHAEISQIARAVQGAVAAV
ncbi:MAG: hypothetical protein ILP09_00710 [Oscillospiraceae bacterium]|nr:hypothetical protein [Oscillospiraceae bacterium]